jgi:hypothetical protein
MVSFLRVLQLYTFLSLQHVPRETLNLRLVQACTKFSVLSIIHVPLHTSAYLHGVFFRICPLCLRCSSDSITNLFMLVPRPPPATRPALSCCTATSDHFSKYSPSNWMKSYNGGCKTCDAYRASINNSDVATTPTFSPLTINTHPSADT